MSSKSPGEVFGRDRRWSTPNLTSLIGSNNSCPNDTRYFDQWAHRKIGSEHVWALHTGGPAVLIGIIDTGVSMTSAGVLDHPDVHTAGRFILGTDYVDGGDTLAICMDTERM